ncbi:hypothetical protein JOF56_001543 [Kibdelosporangium banguiense]|uniref:DUF4367 domain-containing protein n=1 Tax=Kibdelosporangium banguiense TaxID=1365924 RepID=A0ABS4TBA0_9PSEU|nr:hypothetical protein [Kibdelosporangium banguiense]MBP2321158.1 hypothetical protein [Kibdelosporangium banguiense]
MNRTEEEGIGLLAPLRDAAPAERSKVDVVQAVRTGRRQSRRRVVAGMLAAAGLVIVAGVGVPMLIHNLPDATAPAHSTEGFDLLKRVVTVGSAGGFTPDTYETSVGRQVIKLIRADGGQGTATIEVFPPMNSPYPPAYPGLGKRAADVNGREAYWIEPGPVLVWSWAEDSWATVYWENVPDSDVMDKIHRVAQAVLPGESPVTVPFRISREDGLALTSVQISASSLVSSVEFRRVGPDDTMQTITAGLMPAEPDIIPNDQVSSHSAHTDSHTVKILDTGHGVFAFATSASQHLDIDLLRLIATTIVAVDNPVDRANWVPDLLYQRAK